MTSSPPPILLIAGPTASGKSALALAAAEAWGAEIVNADALQVYRDLRVLSARPAPEEEARAPHHLFGVADAAQAWSVGRWLAGAVEALEAIALRGRPAIVVGGTGLYLRALTEGLAPTPPAPAAVRDQAAALYDGVGEDAFREALGRSDPEAAARISPGDRQRLLRAYEVVTATGRPLTAWQGETAPLIMPDRWRAVVLEPPRAALYARCDARLAAMVSQGALDEVAALTARRLDPALPAMKAVGVRELASYLAGERTLEAALALAQQQTRRFAKRQLTWLRNQTPHWPRAPADADAAWLEALKPSSLAAGNIPPPGVFSGA